MSILKNSKPGLTIVEWDHLPKMPRWDGSLQRDDFWISQGFCPAENLQYSYENSELIVLRETPGFQPADCIDREIAEIPF